MFSGLLKARRLAMVSMALLAYVVAPAECDGHRWGWWPSIIAPAAAHKYDRMKVRDILKLKKGTIRQVPLDPGSPSWDSILDMTWEQVDAAANANKTGFKTIRKLLGDNRFDK